MKFSKSFAQQLEQQIQQLELPQNFMRSVERYFVPLARRFAQQAQQSTQTVVVSVNGSQGSGKSTMTLFLQLLLQQHFKLNCVTLSIDDFYLTLADRQQLAAQVHPLFATRGVPGTHDIDLAATVMECLKHCSMDNPCRIPRFDKAIDDRASEARWDVVDKAVDIILFEGWCNHAPLEDEADLANPLNELEENEDHDGVWRHYVNDQLKEYHERLFAQADSLVFMQIPGFEKVYEWRGLQEDKLKKDTQTGKSGVMDGAQLMRFIQHYERITRRCLAQLPNRADIVLKIDDDHQIEAMVIARDKSSHV